MNSPDRRPTRGALQYWVGGSLVLLVLVLLGLASRTAVASGDAGGKILGVTRSDTGVVSVELTPTKLEGGNLVVDMRVTTHTVYDLDKYDLTKITTLEHDGTSVVPTSAPKLEGHHSAGELVFPMTKLPDAFTIKIDGLNKPGVRVFSWP